MALLKAPRVIGSALIIVSFSQDNFAKPQAGSTIRVAVGLDGSDGTTDAGGDLPRKPSPAPVKSETLYANRTGASGMISANTWA